MILALIVVAIVFLASLAYIIVKTRSPAGMSQGFRDHVHTYRHGGFEPLWDIMDPRITRGDRKVIEAAVKRYREEWKWRDDADVWAYRLALSNYGIKCWHPLSDDGIDCKICDVEIRE